MTTEVILTIGCVAMTLWSLYYGTRALRFESELNTSEKLRVQEYSTMSAQLTEKDARIGELEEQVRQLEAVRSRSVSL